LGVPAGEHAWPHVETQAPPLQTVPVEQAWPSGWVPETEQVVCTRVASQVVAYNWHVLAEPGGVQVVPATQAVTQVPDEHTFPVPQASPSAWLLLGEQALRVPVASQTVA
jgi:hypothetical protein